MTPNLLTSGRAATNSYRRTRALDRGGRGRGLDFGAAGSSGMTFLQSQLELIEPNLVKPLQATTHARDITVKNGGGFPEQVSMWASNYASTGGAFYGLQGTNNTDIPEAQVDVEKGLVPTFNWASAFTITWMDLRRMEFAQRNSLAMPFSIQELYDEAVETIWAKALDYVTYTGFLGNAGLVNNANVPAFVVVNGGSGTAWSTKTPTQILFDINFAINQTVQNSGYAMQEGCADTLLVPYTQYAALTLPMTLSGVGWQSTIEYIKKNCVAAAYGIDFKIFPLPNPWISGQGLGGLDRGICYKNTEKSVVLHVPTPKTQAMTIPTTKDGGAYQTLFAGNISAVMFKRTTTQVYMDGI